MNEARNEGGTYQRVEVITGRQRRRRWTAEEKARIVAESLEANANISDVARRHGVARGLLTAWRRQLSSDGISQEPPQGFAAVKIDTVALASDEAPRYSAEPAAVYSFDNDQLCHLNLSGTVAQAQVAQTHPFTSKIPFLSIAYAFDRAKLCHRF